MVTSEHKEECVFYVMTHYKKVSHARACRLVGSSRKTKYYKHKMPEKDKPVKAAIQSVIGGSRKGRVKVIKLVQKAHPEMSAFTIRRVYTNEGYALHKKLRRRIKDNPQNPIEIPLKSNEEWAMEFMSDALISGQKIRTLNIIDHYNRECKGIKIANSFPAIRVIEYLEQRIELHGKPMRIRTDNGPEFRSRLFQAWLFDKGIEWSKIQKGKPQQNAIIERFNKTYREDVLDANLFHSIQHVEQITNPWLYDYNTIRPHQSLNYETPASYAA